MFQIFAHFFSNKISFLILNSTLTKNIYSKLKEKKNLPRCPSIPLSVFNKAYKKKKLKQQYLR